MGRGRRSKSAGGGFSEKKEDETQMQEAIDAARKSGAKFFEYTDRNGKKHTGETGAKTFGIFGGYVNSPGGKFKAKYDEKTAEYGKMSVKKLEKIKQKYERQLDTANWAFDSMRAISRIGSAASQVVSASAELARINEVLRRKR